MTTMSSTEPLKSTFDPGALGLGAFALTTFVLSIANAGIMPSATSVLGLALFYGGIAQMIAGIAELVQKNTFGGTAFVSFGGFWLAFWYLQSTGGAEESGSKGVGIFLLAWAIFTLYMTVAAVKTTRSILAVFVFLTLTFFALALGTLMGSSVVLHTGGWLGLVTAAVAWYGSFAVVVNSTFERTVLPVGPAKR